VCCNFNGYTKPIHDDEGNLLPNKKRERYWIDSMLVSFPLRKISISVSGLPQRYERSVHTSHTTSQLNLYLFTEGGHPNLSTSVATDQLEVMTFSIVGLFQSCLSRISIGRERRRLWCSGQHPKTSRMGLYGRSKGSGPDGNHLSGFRHN
jgi:hypothetical protein